VSAPGGHDEQAQVDTFLAGLIDGLAPEEAARLLAIVASRTATRLHNLTRGQATALRGQPDWPAWAQLQNAARNVVLQASTCRDLARRLTGQRHP
jgi:hypothetical protein